MFNFRVWVLIVSALRAGGSEPTHARKLSVQFMSRTPLAEEAPVFPERQSLAS
jgi:hypothetical protein